MHNITKGRALLTTRVVWACLIAGQALFAVSIAVLNAQGALSGDADAQLKRLLFVVSLGMAGVLIPLGYFLRLQTYKRYWQGDTIHPQGYYTGNLILLALCELVGIFALLGVFVATQWWPYALGAGVAVLVQVINWPTGLPMEPAELSLE